MKDDKLKRYGPVVLPESVARMLVCQATDEGVRRVEKLLEGADSPEERGRRLIADLDDPHELRS